MHINIKRSLALLLACVLFLSLVPTIDFESVEAATSDVHQSRWVADISDFPTSYQAGLERIKSIYPNAQFIYYDTDLDWYNDVLTDENEMKYGRNLIPSNSPSSWKSTDSKSYDPKTDTYTQVEPGWNNASVELVEYYMDPRNFFNEQDIFQFLDLSFTGTETVEGVQAILEPSFMGNKTITNEKGEEVTYAQAIFEIGKEIGVSPYLMACRIRQEQGSGNSSLISGTYPGFEGYYNYFNICASGSTTKAIIENGLTEAKNSGWNTRYKAIKGGAKVLASNYVDAGKNCLYLQHFNMTANNNNVVTYSIYMANTTAPYYENKMMSKSLTDKNAGYTFIIPVYDNMPESPCDMPSGNGNGSYLLKSLAISDFNGEIDIGKFDTHDFRYKASVEGQSFVTIKTDLYAKTSSISINGIKVNLNDSTKMEKALPISGGYNTITITVTAENGVCRDYVLELINNDSESYYKSDVILFDKDKVVLEGSNTVETLKKQIDMLNCSLLVVNKDGQIKEQNEQCVSEDILMIKNMSNQIIYNAPIYIPGDINNDGLITNDDVTLIHNHILEITTLSLDEQSQADINDDGVIDIVDAGIVKTLTGDYLGNYKAKATVTPNIPEDIYENKSARITIDASEGTYFAEGYLIYNEGKLLAKDIYSDGRIHFIVNNNTLLFENGKSYLEVTPIISAGLSDFNIEIVRAYDYSMKKEIQVTTSQATINVQNAELDISVVNNGVATEGDKKFNISTMSITNKAKTSVSNVMINLGQYFTNKDSENVIHIVGLQPGESKTIKLYLIQGLESSAYSTSVTIQYQDSNGIETVAQIPMAFEINNHAHKINWKINDTQHYMSCDTCGESVNENHKYIEKTNNEFVCAVCGYKKSCKLTINQGKNIVNTDSVYSTELKVNGKIVKSDNLKTVWYVNGKKVSSANEMKYNFKSVGYNAIDCVVTYEDVVVTKSINVFIGQTVTENKNPITVSSISCNSVTLRKYNGYEYKIGNGQWQNSPIFKDLNANTTYTVYQRDKATKVQTSISIYTGHNIADMSYKDACGSNTTVQGTCTACNKNITRELSGTSHVCVFANYATTTEATCKHGEIQVAKCEYGCGKENSKTLSNKKTHQFSNYVYDNNSTCVDAGTKTATCDYGCGEKHTMIIEGEPVGHQFVYQENKDATVISSKTKTGTCSVCGISNIGNVDGTRLIYVQSVNIQMNVLNAEDNLCQLLVSSNSDHVNIKEVIWTNSENVAIGDNPFVIKETGTYSLKQLSIGVDETHQLYDHAKIYINGKLFNGERVIDENGNIVLFDIGQLVF